MNVGPNNPIPDPKKGSGDPTSGSKKDADDQDLSSQPVEIDAKFLPKIISFDTLARCGDEIWIENNGQIYRLRRTKQGKLILTK
jgi:hemin uptake protein HemP